MKNSFLTPDDPRQIFEKSVFRRRQEMLSASFGPKMVCAVFLLKKKA
jgi:hypothetical protein